LVDVTIALALVAHTASPEAGIVGPAVLTGLLDLLVGHDVRSRSLATDLGGGAGRRR
jgi:hypothetical protein